MKLIIVTFFKSNLHHSVIDDLMKNKRVFIFKMLKSKENINYKTTSIKKKKLSNNVFDEIIAITRITIF